MSRQIHRASDNESARVHHLEGWWTSSRRQDKLSIGRLRIPIKSKRFSGLVLQPVDRQTDSFELFSEIMVLASWQRRHERREGTESRMVFLRLSCFA